MCTYKYRIDHYPTYGGFFVMVDKWQGAFHLDMDIADGPFKEHVDAEKRRGEFVSWQKRRGFHAVCTGD